MSLGRFIGQVVILLASAISGAGAEVEARPIEAIATLHGIDYARAADAYVEKIIDGVESIDQEFSSSRSELAARAAEVRVRNPYIGPWLRMQHASFVDDLVKSDRQQKAWKDGAADAVFGAQYRQTQWCEVFAFYALSADVDVNQKWTNLPLPAAVDPLIHRGHGQRHDDTYVLLLEMLVFEPLVGEIESRVTGRSLVIHCRAAWCRLLASYLIAYPGPNDDPLRRITVGILRDGIVDAQYPSPVRDVWLETFVSLVVDLKNGADIADMWIKSGDQRMTVAGVRSVSILARRAADDPSLRRRLLETLSAVSGSGDPAAECAQRFLKDPSFKAEPGNDSRREP
jgi:hypothetical protein